MQDWQTWFKNLIAKNYFFTKLTNTDEIASPIVKAIREKEIPVADYSSLVSAIESVREAIDEKDGVEEVTVKNLSDAKIDLTEVVEKLTAILNKEEKDVVFPEIKFPEQKDIDLSPVIKALGKIEKSIPKYEKQEIADYTELLLQMITLLDRKPTDLSKIESSLGDLSKTEDISILADWLKAIYEKETKELPDFKFDKNNRLLVAVDKVGGGGGGGLTQIETNKLLTLATEEKQGVFNEYAPAGQDISGDPMYFAGLKADGSWYIKRMYLSGDYTTKYANGTSGFDWSSRASLSYADFNTLTW